MWPLIEIAVEPKSLADREKLGAALQMLLALDETLRTSPDSESGQTILGGMTERQLDIAIDVLKRIYKVDVNVGQPQVAYRETLGRAATISRTYETPPGRPRRFAKVTIFFRPVERGIGYSFESKIVGDSLPRALIAGAERGVASAMDDGLLLGFPVIDFAATLTDAGYDEIDSSALAFEIAARAAFQELRETGAPRLLEPVMKVEVTTPEDYIGDVIGDLNSRKGMILGTDQRGSAFVVVAMVPLANMFGYVNNLRSMSEGRASFQMDYHHYDVVALPGPPDDVFPPAIGMRA